jgi:hypothetical protein
MDSRLEFVVYLLSAIGVYVLVLGLSLLIVVTLLVRLPSTYFLDREDRQLWVDHHPVARLLLHLLKNIAGVGIVALGLLLSLPGIPGQGLLTVLIGLMLVDFPGKRHLEKRLIQFPRVRQTVDRLRQHYGKPPLALDLPDHLPVREP